MDERASALHNLSLSQEFERILHERARSLAQGDEQEQLVDLMGLLLFRLGDEWYAVRIEGVREIYNEYVITPVPCVPAHILGVINIRGEIMSVADLAALMGLSVERNGESEQLPAIVVSNDVVSTAIVADEIGDIVDIARDAIEPPLAVMDKTHAEYVSGSVYIGRMLIGVVNLDKVLEPIDRTA